MTAYFISFLINLFQTTFKIMTYDMSTMTVHTVENGLLNSTITANKIHVPRATGYLRVIRTSGSLYKCLSPDFLTFSENWTDASSPIIIRKTKAIQEIIEPIVDSVIMIQRRKDSIMLISLATVSKSLLIVLGTLSESCTPNGAPTLRRREPARPFWGHAREFFPARGLYACLAQLVGFAWMSCNSTPVGFFGARPKNLREQVER